MNVSKAKSEGLKLINPDNKAAKGGTRGTVAEGIPSATVA
jgi:hypothetical protein